MRPRRPSFKMNNHDPQLKPSTVTRPLLRQWRGGLLAFVLLNFLAGGIARADPYYFVTLAGSGAPIDHTDGSGANARLMNPTGVAVDGAGNIYIADGGDHTVRKVTPGGSVSTLAGASGQAGSNDGAYTDARFLYPFAIAVDIAGSVYVTDTGSHTVRKIANGSVTTIAGTAGVAGRADGVGTAALFNAPQGIAVDATGIVYVSDTNNSTLRKIAVGGVVTTLAGNPGQTGSADGTGGSATFNYPTGLAVDSAGNIYVADFDTSVIRKVTPAGAVSTFVGSAAQTGNADGQGSAARFDHPMGVAVDGAGNIYVMDTSSQTIRLISPAGVVSTRAGTTGLGGRADGSGAAARFFYATGIAATSAGTVYVADTGNHTLRVMTAAGSVGTLAGSVGQTGSADGSGSSALFAYPAGLAVDASGNVFVADHDNSVIRKITPGGAVSTFAGAAGLAGNADGAGGAARFNDPTAVAVDGSGNVFVADAGNSTIRKITPDGSVTTFAGQAGVGGSGDGVGAAAHFNAPQGVAVDNVGNVYVADTNNNTVRKITSNGTVTTLAGVAGQSGSGDGPGGSARFSGPIAVAVDTSGNVYVADFDNATIRKIAVTTGSVITLAGDAGQPGDTDGNGSLARFNQPYAVAADNNGNVYVADTYNRVIRKVTASGGVATVTGSAARFYYPQGIAVDNSGNLYVADGDNQAILQGWARRAAGRRWRSFQPDGLGRAERDLQPRDRHRRHELSMAGLNRRRVDLDCRGKQHHLQRRDVGDADCVRSHDCDEWESLPRPTLQFRRLGHQRGGYADRFRCRGDASSGRRWRFGRSDFQPFGADQPRERPIIDRGICDERGKKFAGSRGRSFVERGLRFDGLLCRPANCRDQQPGDDDRAER